MTTQKPIPKILIEYQKFCAAARARLDEEMRQDDERRRRLEALKPTNPNRTKP